MNNVVDLRTRTERNIIRELHGVRMRLVQLVASDPESKEKRDALFAEYETLMVRLRKLTRGTAC